MPSQLDNTLTEIMDRLTGPGEPLEVVPFKRFGVDLPSLKNAPANLPAFFEQHCTTFAEREFLVDGDLRLTFAEVYALARQCADGLILRYNVARGERVGIAARNSANWVVLYMAVLMSGGCAVLLNGWWTGDEMAAGVDLAQCRLVFADAQRASRFGPAMGQCEVVQFGHGNPREGLAELLGSDAAKLPELTGDDLATILFTSGSTGQCKGAVSDHRGVVQGALSFASQALMIFTYLSGNGDALPAQPSALVAVPLFHVTGEVAVLLTSFAIGRRLVIMTKWQAAEAMRLIEAEKISYFIGVPLMSYEMAMHPEKEKFDLSSCLHFAAGGAPRPIEHVRAVREALPGSYPWLGYGLTETQAVGCGNINENYLEKPGSTGTASRPLVEVEILDDAGAPLPAGTTGEVAIRSIANFLGYWRNPEATAEAVTSDGFFRTGDLGYLDADGYLFIVDRKKDIIIRGGENIAASEVEAAIYAHPDVLEASVFGLPDDRFGEVPVAVFIARAGAELHEDGLRAHLSQHIAAFKIPARFFEEHERLPRLGTEKVDKRALKAKYAQAGN